MSNEGVSAPSRRSPREDLHLGDQKSSSGGEANRSEFGIESVAAWVGNRAAATPGALAISAGSEQLSYSDLDTRANQLAHRLRAYGVGPEVVVGLFMTRSASLAVGALGILKAGGAYLPLSEELPGERVDALLRDAGATVLVTELKLAHKSGGWDGQVVVLDQEAEKLSHLPSSVPENSATPDNLAYVIYTSGSTGTPKGVEVSQRNLLNLIAWHQQAFAVTSADRATQLAGVGFDAAVWELWPYLTAGASVHLVPDCARTAPDQLRDWLVKNNITISFVPTVLAEFLLALEWPRETSLRVLLTGADTLHRYPSPRLPFQLVNNYGPTECTVVTTSGPVPATDDGGGLPPIGRPIANMRCYLLDENLRQVADGQPGELYVGGVGVARGYRNRPDLTAERFIPDPFDPAKGGHLYRTGDLVRWLADGQLAFLGRTDEQIKIAGYRIEPDEIVLTLEKHPDIQASCVIAREDAPDSKKLVAYLVAKPAAQLTESKLRGFLQQKLPPYMVPSVFVLLDMLPITPNGKVDRAALPAPESANMLRDAAVVAPRTPIEQRLSEILSGLLGLAQVSVEDNFFLLGGHSLLGTQLIGRVRDAFGVELSLRTVFESSTIAQLSSEVEKMLLAKLESMSEEEVQRILSAPGGAPTPTSAP
ncbi:MAG TPA: amino acid adenylation domain-containing protein [Candidatus Acidoferrum sp.]|nr:amino acid adenylation domain-containing protein [Candidatus Acidoferrum sp.]